jgi:hypothetical protein
VKNSLKNQAEKLLIGAYDLHTHTIPSHLNRALDDFELVEQASTAGMAGVLLKNHYEPTESRAILVNRHSTGLAKAYGAVVLNHPVGGLNVYAVMSALEMGASIVFMPTRDAANCLADSALRSNFFERPGISILDEEGKLKSKVYEIMDVVKKYGAALATGHISPKESEILCREGTKRGVRMVLTHPEWYRTAVPVEVQKALAERGTWIEKCFYNLEDGSCTVEEMAAHIKAIGAHHCFLSTDRGQRGKSFPTAALQHFIEMLLKAGINEDEIRTMVQDVPRKVLGIE